MGIIREIEVKDIPALFVVRPQTRENAMTVKELASIGITPDSMVEAINDYHRGWLCEDNGQVVGFAMGDSNNAEFTVMAMLPDYGDKGIGGKLLLKVGCLPFHTAYQGFMRLSASLPIAWMP